MLYSLRPKPCSSSVVCSMLVSVDGYLVTLVDLDFVRFKAAADGYHLDGHIVPAALDLESLTSQIAFGFLFSSLA